MPCCHCPHRDSQIGTGFSDAALQEHYAFFRDKTLDRQPPNYVCSSTLVPDVWLDAVQVWEVKAADLSISPHHKAAAGKVRFCACVHARMHAIVCCSQ